MLLLQSQQGTDCEAAWTTDCSMSFTRKFEIQMINEKNSFIFNLARVPWREATYCVLLSRAISQSICPFFLEPSLDHRATITSILAIILRPASVVLAWWDLYSLQSTRYSSRRYIIPIPIWFQLVAWNATGSGTARTFHQVPYSGNSRWVPPSTISTRYHATINNAPTAATPATSCFRRK
jgi:hypothetical protein